MENQIIEEYKAFAKEMKELGFADQIIRKAIVEFYDNVEYGEQMADKVLD